MTEVVEECPPVLCQIESCLEEAVELAGYSIGGSCGKGKVTANLWITNMTRANTKGGRCGGADISAELVVELETTKCSKSTCTVIEAAAAIKEKICSAGCCSKIRWLKTERIPAEKNEIEIWTDIYSVYYHDPQAK